MVESLACLVFQSHEGIRVFPKNLELARIIDDTFDCYWKEGTQGIEHFDGYSLVKVPGLRCIESDQKSIGVKRAAAHLFRNLFCEGWIVDNSDVASQDFANVIWLKRGPEGQMENLICISLVKDDYMQMINMPQFMTDAVLAVIKSRYPPGIDNVENVGSGVVATRLKDSPWVRGFATKWPGLKLLTTIIQVIERQGYAFYALLNYNGNSETFFFTRYNERYANKLQYAMFSFENQQQLEAYNLPEAIRENIKNLLLEHYLPDIESVDPEKGVFRLTLEEIPLAVKGDPSLTTQKLVTKVFELMHDAGFRVHFVVSNKVMFRYTPAPPALMTLAGVSIIGKNRFLITNSPGHVLPVRNCILDFWPKGIAAQKQLDNAHDFTIDGRADETTANVENFMRAIASLENWNLFASVNIFSENALEKSCLNGVMFFARESIEQSNGFHGDSEAEM